MNIPSPEGKLHRPGGSVVQGANPDRTSFASVYTGGKQDERKARGTMKPIHHEADALRKLLYSGMKAYEKNPMQRVPNPVWMQFNDRCQHPIKNAAQLRTLLDYYAHSDDVMVIRYTRDGCVSCNALDKVMEFQCREFKRNATGLHFYDLNAADDPVMVDGMRRFPSLKAFSSGNWQDVEFKPPQEFRDAVLNSVQNEVEERGKTGQPVTALEAEEMYFSVAAPAMMQTVEDSLWAYYNAARVRMHNYWKQVSVRRTWYFRKYIEPSVDTSMSTVMKDASIFGEMKPSEVADAMEKEEIGLMKMAEHAQKLAEMKPPMKY